MSTATIATILLLGVFLVLVFLRVPVVYAIGVASLLDFFYLGITTMQMRYLQAGVRKLHISLMKIS